ncbi:hypothetical protein BT96DRAFT_1013411 [Gymnopus androsaceus JB14]|uniref:GATA-type domain-containing protein n=1 Tax=Gymnopus androsaceus JB14 TaxID=1447944 RepID=A0A6A4ICN0_9AGAR|nr:hypothetical protein BT96DRAFT_1013411 [Gymnopus androsaceus JB14]
MQNDLSEQRMRVSFLEGTMINIQRENDASSQSLRTIQKSLKNFLDLGVALGFEREQSSFLPQEGIAAEHSDSQDTGNIEDSTKIKQGVSGSEGYDNDVLNSDITPDVSSESNGTTLSPKVDPSSRLFCHSCNVRETPHWREGPDGQRTLCDMCGLHYAKLIRKN